MPSYSELLKSPLWQKKRLEVLESSGWKCHRCYNEKDQLHVHHRRYRKGAKPWEYDNESFSVLCESCHTDITREKETLAQALDEYEKHNLPLGVVIWYLKAAVAMLTKEVLRPSTAEQMHGIAMFIGVPRSRIEEILAEREGDIDVFNILLDKQYKDMEDATERQIEV